MSFYKIRALPKQKALAASLAATTSFPQTGPPPPSVWIKYSSLGWISSPFLGCYSIQVEHLAKVLLERLHFLFRRGIPRDFIKSTEKEVPFFYFNTLIVPEWINVDAIYYLLGLHSMAQVWNWNLWLLFFNLREFFYIFIFEEKTGIAEF